MRAPASIGDHAIIGDGRSAALVTRAGEIDWLCWPRFDSDALLARILDGQGGVFSIAPTATFHATRSYLPDTNVLETRFATDAGAVVVVDFMPIGGDPAGEPGPEREILRLVRCERGEVEIEVAFDPRPGFGRIPRRWRDAGELGAQLEAGGELVVLLSEPLLPAAPAGGIHARLRLREGQVARFSFSHATEAPAVIPPLGLRAEAALERTVAWWRHVAAQVPYHGPFRQAVVRSALALKLLAFAPSGAIVAAPTTSLPERLGGPLNWDHRYCWLRDAAHTTRALLGLGLREEAERFVAWALHASSLSLPALRGVHDVYGRAPPPETELVGLAGHAGSRPVRLGNAARDQLQLHVHGEVVGAAAQIAGAGLRLDRESGRVLAAIGDHVCSHWRQPDDGLWEPRGSRCHHTHSKVLCWAALDRLLELDRSGHVPSRRRDDLAAERQAIAGEIERRGFHGARGSYVQVFDGEEVDAALLQLPWYGYAPAGGGRMRGTFARIERELGAGRGLLHRHRTGPQWGGNAVGSCGFWAAEHLALGGGTAAQAESRLASLLTFANDVGLFSAQTDPATGEPLGNFPQAATHVALVNACITLQDRLTGREMPPHAGKVPASGEEGAR